MGVGNGSGEAQLGGLAQWKHSCVRTKARETERGSTGDKQSVPVEVWRGDIWWIGAQAMRAAAPAASLFAACRGSCGAVRVGVRDICVVSDD